VWANCITNLLRCQILIIDSARRLLIDISISAFVASDEKDSSNKMTTTDEVETNEIGINVIPDQMQYKDKIINTEPKPEMIDAAVTTDKTFKKDKANNTMLIKKTHVSTSTPKIKTEKSQVNIKKCEQNHAATNTPVKYFSSAS
jgi:hypothetical protein